MCYLWMESRKRVRKGMSFRGREREGEAKRKRRESAKAVVFTGGSEK